MEHACNLSKGVREKGRAEGRAEGMADGNLSAIKNLIKNMDVSVEQAMSVLEIPEAEQQKYLDMLKLKKQ